MKSNTVGSHKTNILTEGELVEVIYHNTKVVRFNLITRAVELNTGGYLTQITKRRMNQASKQYGLGFQVYQRDFTWFVQTEDGRNLPFDGNKIRFLASLPCDQN